MPIVTNLAETEDIYAMAKMSRDEVEQGLVWRYKPSRILSVLQTPETTGVCVRFKSEKTKGRLLLGFGIMRLGLEDAHIILLAVDSDVRRRGVGTRILQWLEETALVAGSHRIVLETRKNNAAARRFYEKFGFVQHRRLVGYYPTVEGTTEDGLYLVKTLRTAHATS